MCESDFKTTNYFFKISFIIDVLLGSQYAPAFAGVGLISLSLLRNQYKLE